MRLTALFCAPSLAFLLAPTSWAGGEIVEQPTGQTSATWQYQVCRAVVAGVGGGRLPVTKKAVNYISGVMAGTQSDVGKRFAAFVAEKYGITVQSSECQTVRDEAAGRALIDQTWTSLPTNAYYEEYVKTGWTAGSAAGTPTPPTPAETSETVAYDCDVGSGKGGFSITATYYYASGKRTADRATVTLDGKTTEMKRDSSDASGSSFGAANGMGISKFQSGAHFYRGSTASNCVTRVAASPTPPTQSSATATAHDATPNVTSPPTVAPQQAKAVFVICRADSSPGEPHFYNPPVDGGGGSYATWQPAYQSYLVEKHHFRGSGVGCGYYPTAAAAKVDFDQWVANAQHDSTLPGLTFKVIVTDWKFK